MPLTRDQEKKN